MTFLENLAEKIVQNYPDSLSKVCVVFPSARAGIYFRKHLSKKAGKTVWSPGVLSIKEFIEGLSDIKSADSLMLIFELYESYKKFSSGETFDRFYPWGEVLLNDFDDIDKNLADAGQIFRIVKEHKKIEEDFSLFSDADDELRRFWRSFSGKEIDGLENDFLKLWEVTGKIYDDFRSRLAVNNYAYEGMVYRNVCEKLARGGISIKWEKIIFAGFNFLHASERKIMEYFLNAGKAEIYWDADNYFMSDSTQEAGRFILENIKKLKLRSPEWIDDNFSSPKKIRIIGAPLQVNQAKVLGNLLKGLAGTKEWESERTAVVLPDENLLFPVLHSLPGEVKYVNVTMGFPFRNSSLYNLAEVLARMQNNMRMDGRRYSFYHSDVSAVLMNPYIKFIDPSAAFKLINSIRKENLIYVPEDRIKEYFSDNNVIFQHIFSAVKSLKGIFDYLYSILDIIAERVESSESKFDPEYFFKLYGQLNRLSSIFGKYPEEADLTSYWKLLLEALRSIRIPFTGEPLKGLQVMGLLETRALDFDNVFILSMNEGVMPAGSAANSFIPFSLRKVFRLPTFEDNDTTYAYYFYRLLQRAKNIWLIYNTEVGKVYSGEKSRFILQAENELASLTSADVKNYIVQNEVAIPKPEEIIIKKSPEMVKALASSRYLSASAVSEYIKCKLQFYLKRIAGLDEEESVDEALSGASFGSILHGIVKTLYEPYRGKAVTEDMIKNIKEELDKNYDVMFADVVASIPELKGLADNIQGRNLLFKRIIKKLAHKILDSDRNDLPFRIVDLERSVETEIEIYSAKEIQKVRLGGRIDRLDEKDGVVRIIDYKTGRFNPGKTDKMDGIFKNPDKREQFQALFYAYLYSKENPSASLTAGIYSLQKMRGGIHYFYEDGVDAGTMKEFSDGLKALVGEILDTSVPFDQTDDEKRCEYCPFTGICYRESKT